MKTYVRCLAAIGGIAYFGLFTALDIIVELRALHILFLAAVSGFEYLGIEDLVCTGVERERYARFVFFALAVFVPLGVYVLLAAAEVQVMGTGFSSSAYCALGAAVYRAAALAIEQVR